MAFHANGRNGAAYGGGPAHAGGGYAAAAGPGEAEYRTQLRRAILRAGDDEEGTSPRHPSRGGTPDRAPALTPPPPACTGSGGALTAVESVHVYLNSSGSSNAEVAERLAECAIPGKTHVYAAVLGLLNYEAKHVVEDRLSCVAARLRHELGAGDEVAIKMILKLLVPTSVLAPEAALRAAADAGREARFAAQCAADAYARAVLMALPHAAAGLQRGAAGDALRCLADALGAYMALRSQV